MTKLKFGIVGVGQRGTALARAALLTNAVDIVAFADPHAPSRAGFAGLVPDARAHATTEDLLADADLDAVIVAAPNDRHADVAIAALQADKHVLCEKPLALSIEDCERIGATAAASDRIVQVAMELRYAPLFRRLRDVVASGRVGAPKMLWCHEFRPPFKPGVGDWRLSRASSGGTLLEKNCHHFDLFNWVGGARPVRVYAIGSNDTIYADRDILDRAWVLVEYANGVSASLGLALFFDREEQLDFGVIGAAGKATCALPAARLAVDTPEGSERETIRAPHAEAFAHGGEVEQQLAFVQSIQTGEPPLVDIDAAKWSHAVALAAEASLRSGHPVSIGSNGHVLG